MASQDYGLRYQMEVQDIGENVTLQIEFSQLGYSFGVEPNLVGGSQDPVVFVWEPQETNGDNAHWLVMTRKVIITVLDEAGRLNALGGIQEKEMLVVIKNKSTSYEYFSGWVKPGNYSHDRYLNKLVSIEAVRGETNLKNKAYATSSGALYTGTVSPLDVIYNIRNLIGLTGLVETCFRWFVDLATPLTSSMDMFDRLQIDQGEFKDKDDNAITGWSVLLTILEQYQLQLIEDAGIWYIMHRTREPNLTSNTFSVFSHREGGFAVSGVRSYYVDIWGSNNFVLDSYTLDRTRPFKYVSAVYNHQKAAAGVIGNPGFEDLALEDVVSTATDNWIPSSSGVEIKYPGSNIEGGTQARGCRIPPTAVTGGVTFPDDFVTAARIRQTTTGIIEGGEDRRMQFEFSFKAEFNDERININETFFAVRLQVGSYWLYYDATNQTYDWATTPANSSDYLVFSPGRGVTSWQRVILTTEPLWTGSAAITGTLYIEARGPVEDDEGFGASVGYGTYDDFDITMLDANEDLENEAEQRTAIYSASNNVYGPEAYTLLYGTGPTSGHTRRQQILDGGDNTVDDAGNWQIGDDFSGDPSGDNHLQFWVKQRLRQNDVPLLKASMNLSFPDSMFSGNFYPYNVFRDRRQLILNDDVLTGAVALPVQIDTTIDPQRYGVIHPKRPITLGGVDYQVNFVKYVSEQSYILYLDSPITAPFLAGMSVYQDTYFSFNGGRYRFRSMILETTGIEIREGNTPDISCAFNVKPGSLRTDTIPDFIGQPCFDQIASDDTPAGRLYLLVTSGNAGGPGRIAQSLLQDNTVATRDPDGSIRTIIVLDSTPVDMWINFALEYIYVVLDNNDVYRYNLEGGDKTQIVTGGFSGYGDIVSISGLETGTYGGSLFFNVQNQTEPGDNELYRTLFDGSGGSALSVTGLGDCAIHARVSTNDIIAINSGFVRYSIASGGAATSINSGTITTPKGLAHSSVYSRVFTIDGTTFKWSPDSDGNTSLTDGDTSSTQELLHYDDGRYVVWSGGTGLRSFNNDGQNEVIHAPLVAEYGAFTLKRIIPNPFTGDDIYPSGSLYVIMSVGNAGAGSNPQYSHFVNNSLAVIDPSGNVTTLATIPSGVPIDMTISWLSGYIFILTNNSKVYRYDLLGNGETLFLDGAAGYGSIAGITHFDTGANAGRLVLSVNDSHIFGDDHVLYMDFDTPTTTTSYGILNGRAGNIVARETTQDILVPASNGGPALRIQPLGIESSTLVLAVEYGGLTYNVTQDYAYGIKTNGVLARITPVAIGAGVETSGALISNAIRLHYSSQYDQIYVGGGTLRIASSDALTAAEISSPKVADIGAYDSSKMIPKP